MTIKAILIQIDVDAPAGADQLSDSSRGSRFDPAYVRCQFWDGNLTNLAVLGRKPEKTPGSSGSWTYASFCVDPNGDIDPSRHNPEIHQWIVDAAAEARQTAALMTIITKVDDNA